MSYQLSWGAEPSVMSFKEWKSEKISTVRSRYNLLESQYLSKKSANPKDSSLKALYDELKLSKSYETELQDLSVTDYFVGYLSQYKSKKGVFQGAVNRLDSSEIAELMAAYANSLLKTSGEGISTSSEQKKAGAALTAQ